MCYNLVRKYKEGSFMNDNMNNILLSLINQASKNKDHEASHDLISIAQDSEQVRNLTTQLENAGLITNVSIYGKTHFSCNVTEKAFEYVEEKSHNES